MKYIFLLIVFLSTNLVLSQKIKIDVKGDWNKTLGASNISQVGEDYNQSYESNYNQSTIKIKPIPNNWYNRQYMSFKVFINKENINWHSNLKLYAKVSPNYYWYPNSHHWGSNNYYWYSPGTNYQEITDYSNSFFGTIGAQGEIPIKYKIEGLSVLIPAENYSAEIIYTILNL